MYSPLQPRQSRSPRQPAWKKKVHRRVRFLGTIPALEALSHGFNELPKYRVQYESMPAATRADRLRARLVGPSGYEVWREAEQILMECNNLSASDPLPTMVVHRFNVMAQDVRTKLSIGESEGQGERRTWPAFSPQSEERDWNAFRVIQFLWATMCYPDRVRLQQCLKCRRWFVDKTINKTKQYCSTGCRWKWWDRERRREAARQRQRKGTTRKKA